LAGGALVAGFYYAALQEPSESRLRRAGAPDLGYHRRGNGDLRARIAGALYPTAEALRPALGGDERSGIQGQAGQRLATSRRTSGAIRPSSLSVVAR